MFRGFVVVVSHIHTFSVLFANPKRLLYTVANPARGLLNRKNIAKRESWQHPLPPHATRMEEIKYSIAVATNSCSIIFVTIVSCVRVCVCVFIKLHITTQSGPVILVILCHSH